MYIFAETRDTHLMVVDVEIQSLENCRKNVTNDSYVHGVEAIDSRVICAFTKGQDACQVRHQTYFTP